MIGGSSRLKLLQELLTEIIGDAIIETCGERDIVVALGLMPELVDNKEEPQKTNNTIDSLNFNKQIICPKCGSDKCYKLIERIGYHCTCCSWEGPNVHVKF